MSPAPSLYSNAFKMYQIRSIIKDSLNKAKTLNEREGAG